MYMQIIRDYSLTIQSIGVLQVMTDNDSVTFKCNTLEPCWHKNYLRSSCIPVGTYKVIKRKSLRHGNHFHVLNVADRDMVLIHAGNFANDTKGCILVGDGFYNLNQDSVLDISNSKKTLATIWEICPQSFTLTIKNPDLCAMR